MKVTSLSRVQLLATPINLLFQILIENPRTIFLHNFLRQETASTSHGKPFSALLAMKVGLLQGLVDVEVRALAQHDCSAQAGDAVGWTGDEVV